MNLKQDFFKQQKQVKMKNKTKIDPYTGETFEAKRRNQLFATRQNRIDYHNEQAALLRDEKAPANSPLHRNLQILKPVECLR